MEGFYSQSEIDNIPGMVVKVIGKNNKILIEKGSKFEVSQVSVCGDNNIINIGKANLYHKLHINFKGNNKRASIGSTRKNIRVLKLVSIRGDFQTLNIGDGFSCGGLEIQMNDGNESCTIGNSCLFSWGIKIRTSDGHSIVDLSSGLAINFPKNVNIADRVWVGEDVTFLKGAMIEKDCVVGSRSVVTKKHDKSNCIIAGFPAKVVKENIKWDNRMPYDYNNSI
ncbi:hypothetical protein [Vibrio sp. B1FLJ16]|uniref:acyltransferase n=1 Tax=Vibrio sp. B1FLJ16 TaxID=2751178 RepID=UPI001AFA6B96|nr:hypothetical protein [Vibrio sp. B1FLJ16]CAD7807341.1 Polysialic acid O-acetyltransferase [Vibrio sp. B1FLJ16]CAE6905407.1 Polysialic acid O-acetyltransferase [Vibrio sp. B1FLJ16]